MLDYMGKLNMRGLLALVIGVMVMRNHGIVETAVTAALLYWILGVLEG